MLNRAFAADHALAQWLIRQVDHDLNYLDINIAQLGRVREMAAAELTQLQRADAALDAVAERHQANARELGERAATLRETVEKRLATAPAADKADKAP